MWAKVQRRPALTAIEMDAQASIRVVPPSFRSLEGDGGPGVFDIQKAVRPSFPADSIRQSYEIL